MLILDIEASGTNYNKHSVVSVGALDFNNPNNQFYAECRIWPGAHIMDGALQVNGFTEEELMDDSKLSEGELITKFITWSNELNDRTLAGQNVSFDRDMMRAGAERAGINWNFAYRTIDTHSLCWMHMVQAGNQPPIDKDHKRSSLSLDAILKYCGIPEEPQPHNALTGALCHGEVASRLLYSKKLLPEFEQFEIPWLER
jgi:DNA polymerase III epsilon subunit-like protein